MINYRIFTKVFTLICVVGLIIVGSLTIYIDPFFHYRKPKPDFYYTLKSQRYQNNGILKHFDYDAIITGTSMTENFKTTEFDNLFGAKSIKVPYSGAKFKELNDAIKVAYKSGKKLKYVVRSLDLYNITLNKDATRNDLGKYPAYLYNASILDDTKYIFNKDVFCGHIIKIIKDRLKGKTGGITSFDEYSNWNKKYKYGKEFVLKEYKYIPNVIQKEFSDHDLKITKENMKVNVIDLVLSHPETTFYLFFPPYSVAWWGNQSSRGELMRMLTAEKIAIEMLLECPNVKLYSFNLNTDIVTQMDHYKDTTHYNERINSNILRYMKNDIGLITKENHMEYLTLEREFYLNYHYDNI